NARPGSPGGDLAMRIRTLSGDRGQAQELHWPPGWQERPTLAMLARGATLAINAGAASIWLVLRGGAELEGREGRFALDAGQWLYLDRESMPSVRAGARAGARPGPPCRVAGPAAAVRACAAVPGPRPCRAGRAPRPAPLVATAAGSAPAPGRRGAPARAPAARPGGAAGRLQSAGRALSRPHPAAPAPGVRAAATGNALPGRPPGAGPGHHRAGRARQHVGL